MIIKIDNLIFLMLDFIMKSFKNNQKLSLYIVIILLLFYCING